MKLDSIRKALGTVELNQYLGSSDLNRDFYECFGIIVKVPTLDFFKHYLRISLPINYTESSHDMCLDSWDRYY